VLQELPEQLPQDEEDFELPGFSLFPPDEMAQQETSFFTFLLPHFSQVTDAAADKERRNFSNTAPHFWHL
jgi:hypothetical protein